MRREQGGGGGGGGGGDRPAAPLMLTTASRINSLSPSNILVYDVNKSNTTNKIIH